MYYGFNSAPCISCLGTIHHYFKIRMACPGLPNWPKMSSVFIQRWVDWVVELLHPVTFAYIELLKKLGCSKVISTVNDNFWMIFPSPYLNAQCITLIIDPASNAHGSLFLICCCCWFLSWVMFKNNAKRKFLWAQKVFLSTHISSSFWGGFYVSFF